jgi:predicted metal-binding protein
MKDYVEIGKQMGFSNAAFMKVSDLVVVPGYRKYCEQNRCGCYGVLEACPPKSGSVEEMVGTMQSYKSALILQTVVAMADINDTMEQKNAKRQHNALTEQLMEYMHQDGIKDVLMIGAGPWKTNSCMSAYCVDAQKMADAVGMKCWEKDGKARFFSLLLIESDTVRK